MRARLVAAVLLFVAASVTPVTVPATGADAGRTARGYWMFATDGGVFSFGGAEFAGTTLNQSAELAGMAPTSSGRGYWLVDDDGDVFAHGDAGNFGSTASEADDISAFATRPQADGYWMANRTGTVEAFGGAPQLGSVAVRPTERIVAMAVVPESSGSFGPAGGTSGGGTGGTTPTTATPPVDPPVATLVGAGDIANCNFNGDEATAALVDAIPGTVFTTGDNAYESGSASEYRNCYEPSWGRHKARTRPVVGNHEYGTSGAAGYFGYFGTAAGTAGEGFYSYDLGAWHVVVLNSNCGAVSCSVGSAQEKWLRADLAASQAACTVALWHHPRFSSGSHGNDLSVQPLWNALYEYGAELVLNGHDHTYERFAPQRPDGTLDNARGIREFVIGTGGRPLYSFNAIKPNSEARNNTVFGVLRLTLRSGSYDFRFVPEAGGTYTDSGSASCHGRH